MKDQIESKKSKQKTNLEMIEHYLDGVNKTFSIINDAIILLNERYQKLNLKIDELRDDIIMERRWIIGLLLLILASPFIWILIQMVTRYFNV